MLNIGIARVRIPDCCVQCQTSEEDYCSVCYCGAKDPSDVASTISAERIKILHNVVPEKLNESK